MDPVQLRRKNIVTEGDTEFGSDSELGSVGLGECIDRACEAVEWGDEADDSDRSRGHGIAVTNMASGSSIDEYAEAEVILERDGTITLVIGAGRMGQGTETTQSQITAEVLAVDTDDVYAKTGDTDVTPWDNGAYADSTTYVTGQATLRAAEDLAATIRERASRYLDGEPDELTLRDGAVVSPDGETLGLGALADRLFDASTPARRPKGRGEHAPDVSPPSFAAQVAEVEVNERTGEFEVTKLVSAVDCGFAINPDNARGQILGAATMGLGQTLSEELVFDSDGHPQTSGLRDYRVLRSDDLPETMESIIVETADPTGPFGAKSVGQVATSGPLAAVPNAIADAVGVRIDELPVTREKIRRALDRRGDSSED